MSSVLERSRDEVVEACVLATLLASNTWAVHVLPLDPEPGEIGLEKLAYACAFGIVDEPEPDMLAVHCACE
jgi:hypothetical protein